MIKILKIINGCRQFGKSIVKDINIEVKQKEIICVIGVAEENKKLFFQVLTKLQKLDSGKFRSDYTRFTIVNEPRYSGISTISQLLEFYSLLYPKMDKKAILTLFEEYEIDLDASLVKLGDNLKFVLFLIAINSNVEYVFCDHFFENLSTEIIEIIKTLIKESSKNTSYIFLCKNLYYYENFFKRFIYVLGNGAIVDRKIDVFLEGYVKYKLVYKNYIYKSLFNPINPIITEFDDNSVTLIMKRNNELFRDFFFEHTPITKETLKILVVEIAKVVEKYEVFI